MIAISKNCLNLKARVMSLEIINKCLGLNDENDNKISFKFSQLLQLFEPCCLVKIDEDRFQLQFEEDFDHLYGFIITNKSNHIPANAINNLNLTLLMLSSRGISGSIINCIESRLIEYSFLQLYQCLEYLFIINNSLSISNTHNLLQETAIDIVTAYKFKTSEEENLYQVIKINTPENAVQFFYDNVILNHDEKADIYKTVASYIYKLRCNIAHLRYNQEDLIPTIEWEKTIDSLSEIVYYTYQRLDNNIENICKKKSIWKSYAWKI